MKRRTLLLGSGLAMMAATGSITMAGPAINLSTGTPRKFADFLGFNTNFLWFPPEIALEQIRLLREVGLKWVRIDLHWDRHEPSRDRFELGVVDRMMTAIRDHGLEAVVYLVGSAPFVTTAPPGAPFQDQYPPQDNRIYGERLAMLALRYPWISHWQIWNEPNIPTNWRPEEDPEAFGALVADASAAMRATAGDAKIVLGGMAYYSQMPLRGGLMLQSLQPLGTFDQVDVLCYHPYTDRPEGETAGATDFLENTARLNALLASPAREIWATEWGWSTYEGPKEHQSIISERTQAAYLLRRLALMVHTDFDRVFHFCLSDLDVRATPRDRYYGMIRRDASPKPAWTALANFLATVGPEAVPTQHVRIISQPRDTFVLQWTTPAGRMLIAWSARGRQRLAFEGAEVVTSVNPIDDTREVLQAAAGGAPRITVQIDEEPRIILLGAQT